MYNSNDIADRIRACARENGVVIKDMLRDLYLGINTLSNMNHGKALASDSLARIADYLGVTVDYLLTGDVRYKTKKQATVPDGLSSVEAILLSAFRRLSPEQQRIVLVQLQALAQLPADQAAPARSSKAPTP